MMFLTLVVQILRYAVNLISSDCLGTKLLAHGGYHQKKSMTKMWPKEPKLCLISIARNLNFTRPTPCLHLLVMILGKFQFQDLFRGAI